MARIAADAVSAVEKNKPPAINAKKICKIPTPGALDMKAVAPPDNDPNEEVGNRHEEEVEKPEGG